MGSSQYSYLPILIFELHGRVSDVSSTIPYISVSSIVFSVQIRSSLPQLARFHLLVLKHLARPNFCRARVLRMSEDGNLNLNGKMLTSL